MEAKKKEEFRIGISVIILLAFMTLGEYLLGVFAFAWWTPLIAIAILKAFFVVRDYMHIGRLFASDEEAH